MLPAPWLPAAAAVAAEAPPTRFLVTDASEPLVASESVEAARRKEHKSGCARRRRRLGGTTARTADARQHQRARETRGCARGAGQRALHPGSAAEGGGDDQISRILGCGCRHGHAARCATALVYGTAVCTGFSAFYRVVSENGALAIRRMTSVMNAAPHIYPQGVFGRRTLPYLPTWGF